MVASPIALSWEHYTNMENLFWNSSLVPLGSRQYLVTTALDRAPDFPSESAGKGVHKPEAQAKGVHKCLSFNALRLRFRLVASDFPGIVYILNGDRSGAVELAAEPLFVMSPG